MFECCLSEEEKTNKRTNRQINKRIKHDKLLERKVTKILLLGTGESGKSTFIKQMRLIHDTGFSNTERHDMLRVIYRNIFCAIQSLIKAMDCLQIPFKDRELIEHADLVMCVDADTIESIGEQYKSAIKELWADADLQECYRRRREFDLIDSAKYFLDDIDRIVDADYLPSNQDIVHSRSATTGIVVHHFQVPKLHIRMVDVGGQRSERRKWIHCFDNVTSLIYLVSISEYDQLTVEKPAANRLMESIALFKNLMKSEWFNNSSIILFLNKKDIFEEKIMNSNLQDYFENYSGPKKDAVVAREYIRSQFVQDKKEVYTHFTTATDYNNIERVFASVRDTLMANMFHHLGFA